MQKAQSWRRKCGMFRKRTLCLCASVPLCLWAITHREQVTFYYRAGEGSGAGQSNSYYYASNVDGRIIEKINQLPREVMFELPDGSITFKTDGGLASGVIPKEIVIVDRQVATSKKTISINGL